jgi:ribosome-associated protein YbcJ (S4-like RNA binding protein)
VGLVHLLSFKSLAEIAALKAEVDGGRNPKDAKVALAKEITARFHSAAAADAAEQDFINRSKGGVPDDIPECHPVRAPLGIGALLKQAGLAPSTSEANRLIDGGGVRVDGGVVSDKGLKLGAGTYVVQVGKRKFARVTRSFSSRLMSAPALPAPGSHRAGEQTWPHAMACGHGDRAHSGWRRQRRASRFFATSPRHAAACRPWY